MAAPNTDIFLRYNRKSIDDRQVDGLIGICKGLAADGRVNQAEAEFLQSWLMQSAHTTDNPIIHNLLDRVSDMLDDDVLDKDESAELLSTLRHLSGEPSELGEVAKTSKLPIDLPEPDIVIEGSLFLFTGTCVYGCRKTCQQAVEAAGGINANSVTKKLNYLVLGTYVTESWAHETFGRKIEKAMEYRDSGVPLAIVTEEHWLRSAGIG